MGREIRRVPRDWEHPKKWTGHYQPMHDKSYAEAARSWIDGFLKWKQEREATGGDIHDAPYFWDHEGASPDSEFYLPEWTTPEDEMAYQIYENVSEGTPVSPRFDTLDEMRAWLLHEGYSEFAANKFIERGFAFSAMMVNGQMFGPGISSWDGEASISKADE
jgi:hypothetical protein